MKNRFRLIATYVFYLSTLIGLIIILLPTNIRYAAIYSLFSRINLVTPVAAGVPTELPSGGCIVLTFDDGWSSQYQAYKKMKSLDLKGTVYICSELVGEPDRLTLDNLNEMYEDGWDICNHTARHVNLTKIDSKRASDEISDCSAWLFVHGFTRDLGYKHLAYPEGSYNEETLGLLEKQGFLTARTTIGGSDTSKLLELGRASLHGMTKKNIRDFILSDQELIILSLHRIVPDSTEVFTELDLKESYFDEVINSIRESQRHVITLTEWYQSHIHQNVEVLTGQ